MKKAILSYTNSHAMGELIGKQIVVCIKPKCGMPFEFAWHDENYGMQIATTTMVIEAEFNGPVTRFITASGAEYVITLTR